MPFNFNRDLVKKLIGLFPAKFIKEHFNETGNLSDIIEEVSSRSTDSILSLVRSYHSTTRQNVYLYTLNRAFVEGDLNQFPFEIFDSSVTGSKKMYYLYPETTFKVYMGGPAAEEGLSFLQPFVVEIENRSLIIKATKLQKDIKTYFPADRNPKLSGETNSEAETLEVIVTHFAGITGIHQTDFNAGIKDLWDKDVVDCHKIRYRDVASTVVVTMNNNLTFKEQLPDKYAEMQHSPIGSSVWKFLEPEVDGSIIDTFTCDPSEGTISITKFLDNNNHLSNVINRILEQN